MGLRELVRAQWDRAGAVAATVLGLLALLLGWIGTSGTELVAKQTPYIVSGAVVGIFLLGVGAVLWLSADFRDEWRQLQFIAERLDDEVRAASESTGRSNGAVP